MSDNSDNSRLLGFTAQIVSAHVSHNSVTTDALLSLITSVHATLSGVGNKPAEPEKSEPVVPIKKSVFPDYIVCLEDGKKLKMLKRHLASSYNMTPDQYRTKWGLPASYPMVAPDYAKHRSLLAKKIGLGRIPEKPPATATTTTAAKPPGRGRKAAAKA